VRISFGGEKCWIFTCLELQEEHLLAKVFSVTKFGFFFKKNSTATSYISCEGFSRGFNECSIQLKKIGWAPRIMETFLKNSLTMTRLRRFGI
jgi:hypothetical protein